MTDSSFRLRVTANDRGAARVSVRRHQFDVGRPIGFDVDYDYVTALEYTLGAVGAEIVTGLIEFANRRRLEIDAIEAVVDGELGNPLMYFEVVGEEGHPGLSCVLIKVYVASPHDDDTVKQLWNDTLKRLPLARTLAMSSIVQFTLQLTSRT